MGGRPREYDHIVVGAGGMGTSLAYYLSAYPEKTLVLERYYENHPFGSSHGKTRILRTAYAEGVAFVPLVLRARQLWIRLGHEARCELFRPTGVLLAGRQGSPDLDHAHSSARAFGLRHELLDETGARSRFPQFRFAQGDAALWDPLGGVLFPERVIRTFRRTARRNGVQFRWRSPIVGWKPQTDGRIRVSTRSRDYLARRLVLAAGAWLPGLVSHLRLPLTIEQQSVFWFPPKARRGSSFARMPAFVWYDRFGKYFYGTPDFGDGVKVGGSRGQEIPSPIERPPTSRRELLSVQRFLEDRLPGLVHRPVRQMRCLYTSTRDQRFIVDFHPKHPNVVLVSACSGHGFKFVSALGQLVASAAVSGRLSPLLAPFSLRGRVTGGGLGPGPA